MGGPKITGDEATLVAGSQTGDQGTASEPSLGQLSSTPARELVGGRYEVLGLLGAGGMGTVYRARDRELDEIVALKVLRRDLAEAPGILDRFRQEAKLARRVTHRNVARTFDIGEHGGDKFLTMELVKGESLATRLARDGALPLAEVARIGIEICEGLAAAHAAGVVHRDLKPDNVLLADDGRVVITDFGIARAIDPGAAASTMGAPIGTPAYMAPEQVQGLPDIDARADVYSLGTILYEALTGRRAWFGEAIYSVAIARLTSPPPDPRAARPGIDAIAGMVMRCMATKREDRYASAAEVEASLRTLAGAQPSETMPAMPTVAARADEPSKKTLAVLPFRNSGKPDDEYLADGLTEDLIDALSMTPGVKVRSRGAIMRFKGVDRDAREIGRELDVQVVVEGSVRKIGASLRVSARVVGVADGFQLWAKRFDRSEEAFLAVGDEAADAIAGALTLERGASPREAPTDPVAIDLYLRARHLYHSGWRAEINESTRLFEQALSRAPNDPMILAGYALAQLRRIANDPLAPDELCDIGRAAAEKALAIAPMIGGARVALATLHLAIGDAVSCARLLREASLITPNNGEVLDLRGRVLAEVGRPDEAIACLSSAMTLDPSLERSLADALRVHALVGNWDKVHEALAHVEMDARHTLLVFLAARLATWTRDAEWAKRILAGLEGRDFPLKPQVLTICRFVLEGEASPEIHLAIDAWGKITGRAKRRPAFMRQLAAEMSAVIGDVDGTLRALESADSLDLIDILWLDRCPLFAIVRDDARFQSIRARVAERAQRVLAALDGDERAAIAS
jgi:serine/threonine-protein kinase